MSSFKPRNTGRSWRVGASVAVVALIGMMLVLGKYMSLGPSASFKVSAVGIAILSAVILAVRNRNLFWRPLSSDGRRRNHVDAPSDEDEPNDTPTDTIDSLSDLSTTVDPTSTRMLAAADDSNQRLQQLMAKLLADIEKAEASKPEPYFFEFDPLFVYGYRAVLVAVGLLPSVVATALSFAVLRAKEYPAVTADLPLTSIVWGAWVAALMATIVLLPILIYLWKRRDMIRKNRPLELDPDSAVLKMHQWGKLRWGAWNSAPNPFPLDDVQVSTTRQTIFEMAFFRESYTLCISKGNEDVVRIRRVHQAKRITAIQEWYHTLPLQTVRAIRNLTLILLAQAQAPGQQTPEQVELLRAILDRLPLPKE